MLETFELICKFVGGFCIGWHGMELINWSIKKVRNREGRK